MLGDRIIVEGHHQRKGKIIFDHFLESNNPQKSVISIAGVSGSGKSEVALVLQELLHSKGITAYLLSTDDYYISHWAEREEVRKETGIIGEKEIYWRKIRKILKGFKQNKTNLYTQRLNKYTDQLEHTRINGNLIDVIICEGLYALYSKFDLGVYLNATEQQTYAFRKKRKKENPDDEFRQFVLKEEGKRVRESKSKANLIIKFEV